MTKYRDLNAPPGRKMADVVRQLREQAEASKTGAAGVKHLGENGDVIWEGTGPDGLPVQKSVKRFQVELDDTTAQAAALAAKIAAAEQDIEAERQKLTALRGELELLDTRVEDVAEDGATRVSAGPVPPAAAPLGAQWISPEGHLYVRIPCEEVPDAV